MLTRPCATLPSTEQRSWVVLDGPNTIAAHTDNPLEKPGIAFANEGEESQGWPDLQFRPHYDRSPHASHMRKRL
jgi:hypothetical protein